MSLSRSTSSISSAVSDFSVISNRAVRNFVIEIFINYTLSTFSD